MEEENNNLITNGGSGMGGENAPREDSAVKDEIPLISIKVVNADGAEMFFRIRRRTPLKKLIDTYCRKQGITRGSVRFLFDGNPIDEMKTPDDLGMEDDDVIDAMVEQTGRCRENSVERNKMSTGMTMTLTREEVHEFTHALKEEMKTETFLESVRAAVLQGPLPRSELDLLAIYEKKQVEYLSQYTATRKERGEGINDDAGSANKSGGSAVLTGEVVLGELKKAIACYPDEETTELIKSMCFLEEAQLMKITTTTPELRTLLERRCDGHGHSHDHGHSHGHGHSHCAPSQEQLTMMNMAIQTLSPEMRSDMENIQRNLMSGNTPAPQEVARLREIQMHIMAFMNTMKRFGGAGGTGTAGDTQPQTQ